MRTLYKYYSYLPKEYFLEPTIKLTHTSQLNDPFESIVPEDIIEYINTDDELKNETMNFMKENKMNRHELSGYITNCLNHCGIVSLSETPRNLLMWAHYGKQHKGICIGYKENLLDIPSCNNEADITEEIPYFYKPVKIDYDSTRLAPNETKILKYENKSIIYNILAHILTTKSDEWVYEKEHRCIVPIYWSDAYIAGKTYFQHRTPENGIIKFKDNEYIVDLRGSTYELNDGDKTKHKLISKEGTSLLKMISSKSIESLYFGCNVSIKYMCDILHIIDNNPETLGHIKIFKFTPNPSRFSLDIECYTNKDLRP
ncbi:DUF2971 domain-containing protein [Aeromonas veronii]